MMAYESFYTYGGSMHLMGTSSQYGPVHLSNAFTEKWIILPQKVELSKAIMDVNYDGKLYFHKTNDTISFIEIKRNKRIVYDFPNPFMVDAFRISKSFN